jgi:hypothetical protein
MGVIMTKDDRATQIANDVFAFVQNIAQDRQILETLVGLAGERGYEINVHTLGRFFELSSGLDSTDLSDTDLETVAGGGIEGTSLERLSPMIAAPEAESTTQQPLKSSFQQIKIAAEDSIIGEKKSKMTSG